MKIRLAFWFSLLASILAVNLLLSNNVGAVNRPANDSERAARNWAGSEAQAGVCAGPYGALWITSDDNQNVFNDQGNITIDYNQKEVYIRLRGSLYSRCNPAQIGYATNIRRGQGANDWRLTDLAPYSQTGGGTTMRRGYARTGDYGAGGSGVWTTESDTYNNYKRIKLNVEGLVTPGTTSSITVPIYRCYNNIPYNRYPEVHCKSENYQVTITRRSEPKWQAEARSYVKKSDEATWGTASRTITAKVGETVNFQHTLATAKDGNDTNSKLDWSVRGNYNYFKDSKGEIYQSSGAPHNQGQVVQANGVFLRAAPSNSLSPANSNATSYTIKSSDIGKKVCQRLTFAPTDLNSAGINNQYQESSNNSGQTKWACVYVPYDYDLTPAVPLEAGCTSSCDKEVEAGTPDVNIPPVVIYPPSTPIKNTQWKLTSFVVRPNQTIPGASSPNENGFKVDNEDSCSDQIYNQASRVFQAGENDSAKNIKNCTVEQTGEINNAEFGASGKLNININQALQKFSVPESAEVGTKYCFALSLSPYRMSENWGETNQNNFTDWYHGKPGCIVVVKKPKVQILNGGLSAEEGVYGLTSTRNGRLFGSWVEYEVIANNGVNSNIATNSVFSFPDSTIDFNGSGSATPQRRVQNYLTFANTNESGQIGTATGAVYGEFGGTKAENLFIKMQNRYSGEASTSSSALIAGDFSKSAVYKPSSDATVGPMTVDGGSTIIIYAPDRTININGDIKHSDGLGLANLSQVVIIARKILINGDASQIDAWLLADEEINTCSRDGQTIISADNLREGVCANRLTVNGPVYVAKTGDSLKLRRTAGSTGAGDGIGEPAEVFNLPPSTYLWLKQSADGNGKIVTTYSRELPVRF